ncbi:MAG: hypothetical protein ABI723_18100 [Bacteroidia bacterium]
MNREQNNFCAYHEIYMDDHDRIATDVEHFNKFKKNNDDYYNYYSVCVAAHRLKTSRESNKKYNDIVQSAKLNQVLFQSPLFFQNKEDFQSRIKYIEGQYIPVEDNDYEAKDLIEFLGWNQEPLFSKRNNHIKELEGFNFSKQELFEFLKKDQKRISFPTAIESKFGIDLSELISSNI